MTTRKEITTEVVDLESSFTDADDFSDDENDTIIEDDTSTDVDAPPVATGESATPLADTTPEATPEQVRAAQQDEQRRFQQERQRLQQQLQELQWQEYEREYVSALQQRQQQWTEQGFSPEEVQQHTTSWQQLENGKLEVAQQKQAIGQYGQLMEAERRATEGYIKMYMDQYGVSRNVLEGAKSPSEMENKALKAQMAAMRQEKTPVTTPDNGVGTSTTVPNREARLIALTNKIDLTDAEHRELGKLTGNG